MRRPLPISLPNVASIVRRPLSLLFSLSCVTACAPAGTEKPPIGAWNSGAKRPNPHPRSADVDQGYVWASETRSPRARRASDLEALCGEADQALADVAGHVARQRAAGQAEWDAGELTFALRASGAPYVGPKLWTWEFTEATRSELTERWLGWLESVSEGSLRRCGVAQSGTPERTVVAGVACEVTGDLSPLPSRARAGQWLTVEAELARSTKSAAVAILGPQGPPRSVPASFGRSVVRASFAVDRAGPWIVQVLGTIDRGPLPVAEAWVHVDVPPPTSYQATEAPGERMGAGVEDKATALELMIGSARTIERVAPLARDRRLDELALAHAASMANLGLLGHDTGHGDPSDRAERAGLELTMVGENVAHASTLAGAHRAIWQSPSHRANLLYPRYDRVGVGVVEDRKHGLWVCELFGGR